ncbi:hypothetical protein [Aminobacter sp. J44]|nr:hypothetical protein [Aminobacter sp. J44]TWG53545.1 hypothetical protein L610_000500000140 [Aminobacter sp. J44]
MVDNLIDEEHAGNLIEKIGVAATAAHVGERLGAYLKKLMEAA